MLLAEIVDILPEHIQFQVLLDEALQSRRSGFQRQSRRRKSSLHQQVDVIFCQKVSPQSIGKEQLHIHVSFDNFLQEAHTVLTIQIKNIVEYGEAPHPHIIIERHLLKDAVG